MIPRPTRHGKPPRWFCPLCNNGLESRHWLCIHLLHVHSLSIHDAARFANLARPEVAVYAEVPDVKPYFSIPDFLSFVLTSPDQTAPLMTINFGREGGSYAF